MGLMNAQDYYLQTEMPSDRADVLHVFGFFLLFAPVADEKNNKKHRNTLLILFDACCVYV